MEIKNMNRGVLSRLIAVAAIVPCCVMALPTAVHAEDVPENKKRIPHQKRERLFGVRGAVARARYVRLARLSR